MLKKIGHIILIPLLLVATMGMTVNMHYCKHKLYDIGIFGQAENCCAPKESTHHDKAHHCKANNHHKSDCQDETVHVDKVDNFVLSSFDFNFQDISFSTLFTCISLFTDLNSTSVAQQVEFNDLNISPPRIQVVLSLLQTYLL